MTSGLTGRKIGVYRVEELLGAGGMGEVYRARDTRLERDVAIKILPPLLTTDPDRLARLTREARVLASLNHPHIGAIYGFEEADGVSALVLELVDGETLADRLRRGPIPFLEAQTIACQIAEALEAAHERGIVHRDLKPANIKLTAEGSVKVLDFGLAKAVSNEAADSDLTESPTVTARGTRAGVILGTAAYMSPEQARGQAVDKRTDIWAFGCVLFELLTGNPAFAGETFTDTLALIIEREPGWEALPGSVPPGIRRLLRRCLEKDARRRQRDIGDARMEMNEIVAGAAAAPAETAGRRSPRRTLIVATVAVSTLVAAAMIGSHLGAQRTTAGASSFGSRFNRLTWDGSFSTEPALSPDGTLVAYASDRAGDGQLDLWLQRISGGEPIRLTDDPTDDRDPGFSPDGSLVAFRSDRNGGGVYVMPSLGGDARLVAAQGRSPRFSPNGSYITYWTGPWLGSFRASGYAIFSVPAIGGTPTRLAGSFVTAHHPIWSPDGRGVLFFGRKSSDNSPDGAFDWWFAPNDGSEPIPTGTYGLLTRNGLSGTVVGNDIAPAPDVVATAWTSRGVVFSARVEQSVNIWRIRLSDAGSAIEGSLERLTGGTGADVRPSEDAHGNLAFQVETVTYVSLVMPLESNTGKVLGPIVRSASDAGLIDARNSLDDEGRFLAYTRIRPNESELWVKDLKLGRDRHVATTILSQLNPIIAHDGSKIAYTVPENGHVAGYVVPANGGTPTKVCECPLQGWFADNRRILAFRDASGQPGSLDVIDVVNGETHTALIDPTAVIGRADIAPNGRWLAFSSRRHIWISPVRLDAPPPPGEWVSVLEVPAGSAERACGWSPDGKLLYLLLERDGFRDLYAQRVESSRGVPIGEPFIVRHLHDPRRRWGSTPYGTAIVNQAFVFTQTELTGTIWLMRPWQRTP